MKIRFRVPEAADPRRDGGLSIPPQQSKRLPPRLRWIFIILLVLSPALWLGYDFLMRWVWIETRGYVLLEEASVNAPIDATVAGVDVANGQSVQKGQLLVRLQSPELQAEIDALKAVVPTPADHAADRAETEQELRALARRRAVLARHAAIVRELAAGGAATQGEVLAAESEVLAVDGESARLQTELARATRVVPADDSARRIRLAILERRQAELLLRAPNQGTVDRLAITAGQVIRHGDPLLTLRYGVPQVIAFIEGKDLRLARPGTRVTVILPNKASIPAVTLGPAPSTQRLPEELARSFDPRNPRLQVLLRLEHLPAEAQIHHLPVSIRAFRYR